MERKDTTGSTMQSGVPSEGIERDQDLSLEEEDALPPAGKVQVTEIPVVKPQ